MDTKKLRQKILDLAIHGKLVPQDPSDEPASVLLERIRAEKERLIAEGKIKRSTKSATSDTSHYENVPKGWCITTIGEVFNLQAGKNISANDIHEFSQEFPYACYGGNGIRGYVNDYNKEGRFPIIGRQGALCGNVNFAEGKFYATEHAVVVTCIAGVNVEWARYVLEAMNLNQYATATAQPGLSVATVNEVEFLLPPLKEQCRIAEFVANCFDAIEYLTSQTNNLRLNLERAKSKILDLAIHGKLVPQDPNDEPAIELLKRINPKFTPCDNPHYVGEIPSNWVWTTLGSIGKWQSGGTPSKMHKEYYGGNIPWLKTGDLNDGLVTDIPEHITELGLENSSAKLNPAGSVLIAMYGATIGKVGILGIPATTNQACCACIEYKGITQQYLFLFLLANKANFVAAGGGGAQPNISKEIITKTLIPLPPIEEQNRIVAKVKELFSHLDMIEKSLQA